LTTAPTPKMELKPGFGVAEWPSFSLIEVINSFRGSFAISQKIQILFKWNCSDKHEKQNSRRLARLTSYLHVCFTNQSFISLASSRSGSLNASSNQALLRHCRKTSEASPCASVFAQQGYHGVVNSATATSAFKLP